MPRKYNAAVSVGGEEIQVPSSKIVNISGPRGMTRSSRVLAPKYTPKMVPTTVLSSQAWAYVCVPATPVEAPDSSTTKDTKPSNLKGKEVIIEKE